MAQFFISDIPRIGFFLNIETDNNAFEFSRGQIP